MLLAIALCLMPDQHVTVHAKLDSAIGLWSAICTRHFVEKPASHCNMYSEFMALSLLPGEKLNVFAGHVREVMCHI